MRSVGSWLVVLVAVGVDADDPAAAGVDLALQLEARVGDLALGEVLLDRLDHAAELVDAREVRVGAALELVGQRLDVVGAAERVDRVRHARLVGDDLLRAQRDPHRLLGGQRERLVVGVRVQRLRRRRARAASASIAVRTMLFSGCWAVSETPAVCTCVRIRHERGSRAPNVSRSSRAQIRRAARILAISSKKSICALKKKLRRGAKSSTSSPRSTACWT